MDIYVCTFLNLYLYLSLSQPGLLRQSERDGTSVAMNSPPTQILVSNHLSPLKGNGLLRTDRCRLRQGKPRAFWFPECKNRTPKIQGLLQPPKCKDSSNYVLLCNKSSQNLLPETTNYDLPQFCVLLATLEGSHLWSLIRCQLVASWGLR